MAKSDANEKAAKQRPGRPAGKKRVRPLFVLIVLLLTIVAALPTFIVVAIGMVPTLVAFIVDLTPGRYLCRCVAGLNVAGVAPFVHKLWTGQNNIEAALRIIGDSLAWLAFYGSAGFGWMLFLSLPGIVAAARTISARRQVHLLRESQKNLAREWGFTATGEDLDENDRLDESDPGDDPNEAAPAG